MKKHKYYMKDAIKKCIENKAYELWEKDGSKQGFDLYYWLLAEQTIKSPEQAIITAWNFGELPQGERCKDTLSIEAKKQSFQRHLGRM